MTMTPFEFFYEHAGYSYNPTIGETPEQGRARCAQALTHAERTAQQDGCSYEWRIDPVTDSRDFNNDPYPYRLWECIARDMYGNVFASLHAIDFGPEGTPWDSPYRRVVEAELASGYVPSSAA